MRTGNEHFCTGRGLKSFYFQSVIRFGCSELSLPIRTLIDPPDKNRWPDSRDPRVVVRLVPTIVGDLKKDGYEGEGGWAVPRSEEDYRIVMRQWRKQSPDYEHKKDESSTSDDNSGEGVSS